MVLVVAGKYVEARGPTYVVHRNACPKRAVSLAWDAESSPTAAAKRLTAVVAKALKYVGVEGLRINADALPSHVLNWGLLVERLRRDAGKPIAEVVWRRTHAEVEDNPTNADANAHCLMPPRIVRVAPAQSKIATPDGAIVIPSWTTVANSTPPAMRTIVAPAA